MEAQVANLRQRVAQGLWRGLLFRQSLLRRFIQADPKTGHQYFISEKFRVDFTGSSEGIPTIRINVDNGSQLYKIRVQ